MDSRLERSVHRARGRAPRAPGGSSPPGPPPRARSPPGAPERRRPTASPEPARRARRPALAAAKGPECFRLQAPDTAPPAPGTPPRRTRPRSRARPLGGHAPDAGRHAPCWRTRLMTPRRPDPGPAPSPEDTPPARRTRPRPGLPFLPFVFLWTMKRLSLEDDPASLLSRTQEPPSLTPPYPVTSCLRCGGERCSQARLAS